MGLATGMIISLARAAAEFAESEQAGLTVNAERCLHRVNKLSTCTGCVDACPVAALRLHSTDGRTRIALDSETCLKCGVCVPVCPVGAIEGRQDATKLLASVAQRQKRGILELTCALHPTPEKGPPQSDLVIRTDGCLGSLGASLLTSFYALGVYHVLLRVDVCASCPLGQARAQINQTAGQVNSLFAADAMLASPVTLLETASGDWPSRPVIAARTPPETRRDFLRSLMTPQEVPGEVRQLALEEQTSGTRQPPAERRRLRQALQFLSQDLLSPEPLAAFPAAQIAANDSCNACGVCARSCPTGAIAFDVDDDHHYRLSFTAGACTDCGVCLDLCEQHALHRAGVPTLSDWLAAEPQILQTGE